VNSIDSPALGPLHHVGVGPAVGEPSCKHLAVRRWVAARLSVAPLFGWLDS
jgi:hypothetical protein